MKYISTTRHYQQEHMAAHIGHVLLLAFMALLTTGQARAQDIDFSRETFTQAGITLPYRKAATPGNGDKAALVIYLHGGSSKGNDNEAQMSEPGIGIIGTWLRANARKAIMLVPQCPKDKSWGALTTTVKALLQTFIDRGVADASQVYILGGSMGGTGTWTMVDHYPGFFAAAMPVAGNPTGLDATKVCLTPIYTVMGTADVIMKISNVQSFLSLMDVQGAQYQFDIEEGWTHEDVCKKSYTAPRLSWLFAHTLSSADEVESATQTQHTSTTWYSLSGNRLPHAPQQRGIYLRQVTWTDGHTETTKVAVP